MKLGLCASLNNLHQVEQIGYDFIEPVLLSLATETEAKFQEYQRMIRDSSIKAECFRAMLPRDMMLVGKMTKLAEVAEYLNGAFNRAKALGGEIIVWGAGISRTCPEGFDRQIAYEQLLEAGHIIGEQAKKYNLIVVIEPLSPAETNMINTVVEGAEFVRDVKHNNIFLLADAYHMRNNGEAFDEAAKVIEFIRHVHVVDAAFDDPAIREFPTPADRYGTSELLSILCNHHYSGRISLECTSRENYDEQIKTAYETLRTWMK